jgi:hypothetical protein
VVNEDEAYPVVERNEPGLERPFAPGFEYGLKRRRGGRGGFAVTREKRRVDTLHSSVASIINLGKQNRDFFSPSPALMLSRRRF